MLERLAAYRDAGADEFVVRDAVDLPLDVLLQTLSRLQADVIPLLAQGGVTYLYQNTSTTQGRLGARASFRSAVMRGRSSWAARAT